jgi:hypothetical protein
VSDRRADVRLHAFGRRLVDVLAVGEVVVALADAGRPPEVVDRDRVVAALGEAERQLLVEAVDAADVRQDHDSDAGGVIGRGGEGRQPRPVGGLEHEPVVRHGRSGDHRNRRQRVQLEAHAARR